ncbi:MAG: hypothetical protein K8I30_08075 [Anaerolineae bacterium]|nr:hypothetical protein [Anaerolineae bacterium]
MHLITSVAVAFVAALFAVVALLSLLRRLRHHPQQSVAEIFAPLSDETRPMNAYEDTQQFPALAALARHTAPKSPPVKRLPLPDSLRMPVQPGTPDQVVLSIEPNEGPTRDQRNVQKLIEFLKQETVEADAERAQKVG